MYILVKKKKMIMYISCSSGYKKLSLNYLLTRLDGTILLCLYRIECKLDKSATATSFLSKFLHIQFKTQTANLTIDVVSVKTTQLKGCQELGIFLNMLAMLNKLPFCQKKNELV